MSRVGKKAIPVPAGVQVKIDSGKIEIQGPKGKLESAFFPGLEYSLEDGYIKIGCPREDKQHQSLHGLSRTLVANMVKGVTDGFEKVLDIVGVGYRANVEGKDLVLQLGYTHHIRYPIPEGIKIEVDKQVRVVVRGSDKQLVGQVAANIRGFRPPEPYKGKGVKYSNEVIKRKVGKAGA